MSSVEILLCIISVGIFTTIYMLTQIWLDFNYWNYRKRLEAKSKLLDTKEHLEEMTNIFQSAPPVIKTFINGFFWSTLITGALYYLLKYIT